MTQTTSLIALPPNQARSCANANIPHKEGCPILRVWKTKFRGVGSRIKEAPNVRLAVTVEVLKFRGHGLTTPGEKHLRPK